MPRRLGILDFDCECRPLTYLGNDYTTGQITAVAWSWIGQSDVMSCILYPNEEFIEMSRFLDAYYNADIVTGHYIRGYDLSLINGTLLEMGLPPLDQKMASDTKLDLKKSKYQSLSQESLAEMLLVDEPKVHMTQPKWRKANKLLPDGRALTIDRVEGDVVQHKALREKLLDIGWLGAPKVWRPQSAGTAYRA